MAATGEQVASTEQDGSLAVEIQDTRTLQFRRSDTSSDANLDGVDAPLKSMSTPERALPAASPANSMNADGPIAKPKAALCSINHVGQDEPVSLADKAVIDQLRSEALGLRVRKAAPPRLNIGTEPMRTGVQITPVSGATPKSKAGTGTTGNTKKSSKPTLSQAGTPKTSSTARPSAPTGGRDAPNTQYLGGYKRVAVPPQSEGYEPPDSRDSNAANEESETSDREGSVTSHAVSEYSDPGPYCWCGGPDNHRWMVGCDICQNWYHSGCINLSKKDHEPIIASYTCARCLGLDVDHQGLKPEDKLGLPIWKRLCRLDGCMQSARCQKDDATKSKYCCREHGIEFMRRKAGISARTKTELHSGSTDWRSNVGGKLSIQELKTLVREVESAYGFHQLGHTAPAATSSTGRESSQLNHGDRSSLQEHTTLVLKNVRSRARLLQTVKSRNAELLRVLQQHPDNSKLKTICGYDRVLANAEILDHDRDCEVVDGIVVSFNEVAEACSENIIKGEYLGVCFEKRCRRHLGWDNMLQQELLHEQSLVEEDIRS